MPSDGNGRTINLFFWDMDVGVTPNTDGDEELRVYNITEGRYVSLTARQASNQAPSGYISGPSTTLSGVQLNGGRTGSDRWGIAEFKVKRNHRYRIEFNNISYSSNALELFVPFSDLSGTLNCPPPQDNIWEIGTC